jgi:hypothetical protein
MFAEANLNWGAGDSIGGEVMNLDDLTLGQLKEIKAACGAKKRTRLPVDHGLQIAVLQRGWVFIGEVKQSGDDYFLERGACIRRWGTTKGLGELAANGPTANTELEPVPQVRFHEAGKVLLIKAEETKWDGKLK